MKVAVIGTGGREHALAVKSLRSPLVDEVHVIPGNTGMLITPRVCTLPGWNGTFSSLECYLHQKNIGFVIVGNEAYLEAGIVNYFTGSDIMVFGPTKDAAKLEYSKDFAKHFMDRHHIPTAKYHTSTTYEEAIAYMASLPGTLVIKQDGLALGKGVLVTDDRDEATTFLRESFKTTEKVVFEEFLEGKEFSLLAFVNQEYYNLMIPARDYKRANDHDQGLNTGGMGAYTPVDYLSAADMAAVETEIVLPTVSGLLADGIEFTGILYFGLMKTSKGIQVIEYNTRFGDPETEVLLEAMESDLVEAILSTFEKKPYPLLWKRGITMGVCLASNGYPRTYTKGHQVTIPEGITCYSMAMQKSGKNYASDGGRVVFVVASGSSIEEARTTCYAEIQKISSEGLFFRKDIGL